MLTICLATLLCVTLRPHCLQFFGAIKLVTWPPCTAARTAWRGRIVVRFAFLRHPQTYTPAFKKTIRNHRVYAQTDSVRSEPSSPSLCRSFFPARPAGAFWSGARWGLPAVSKSSFDTMKLSKQEIQHLQSWLQPPPSKAFHRPEH